MLAGWRVEASYEVEWRFSSSAELDPGRGQTYFVAMLRLSLAAALCALIVAGDSAAPHARQAAPARPEFEVVSIKRNEGGDAGGIRNLPDGTFQMTNQPIRSIILAASPVATREVAGMPDWMIRERYDITAKPPAGTTVEQRREMFRSMFADRFKLVAHVEQQEREVFDLVRSREDRRLGPNLAPSSLDCAPRPDAPPAPPAAAPVTMEERRGRCGLSLTPGSAVSGGVTMDTFALTLSGRAGGVVTNKTGLPGYWAVELTFSPRPLSAAADPSAPADAAPDFFTALQEQLGLRLERSRAMVPVFVIDRIERPTEN